MTVVASPTRPVVASDVMSTPAVSVEPSASVWTAWSLMMQTVLRHLVVASGESCVGVVDDRAVFAEWPMGPLAMRRHRVRELVTPCTTCVLPDTELRTVARTMAGGGLDAVPVVDRAGRLIGIVTMADIVAAVAVSGIQMEEASCLE
jgi:CBS-domain-containing membrane protein